VIEKTRHKFPEISVKDKYGGDDHQRQTGCSPGHLQNGHDKHERDYCVPCGWDNSHPINPLIKVDHHINKRKNDHKDEDIIDRVNPLSGPVPSRIEKKTEESQEYDMHSPEIPGVDGSQKKAIEMEEGTDCTNPVDYPGSDFAEFPGTYEICIFDLAKINALLFHPPLHCIY